MNVSSIHHSLGSRMWISWGVDLNVSSPVVRTQSTGSPFSLGLPGGSGSIWRLNSTKYLVLRLLILALCLTLFVTFCALLHEELLNTVLNELENKPN